MGLYEVERDKISRTPQFIVEIKMTSCDNDYSSAIAPSTCTAVDAGNGSRCYYSPPTCQDIAHFRISTSGLRSFKFCLRDAPLPVPGADIMPMLKSVAITSQKIDSENSLTSSERVRLEFFDDEARWNWNQDKANLGKLTNTGTPSGTFWRRFMRIYRNYANPRNSVKISVGFVATGAVESDFKQRGLYLIDNMELNSDGSMTMTLTDRLKLLEVKVPSKISEGNLLNGAVDGVSDPVSIVVDDASEIKEQIGLADYPVTIQIDSEFLNVPAITGNTLVNCVRGRWGSSIAAHSDNAPWKVVLMMGTERSVGPAAPMGRNPIDIIKALLLGAGIAGTDIDGTTLDAERDTWLPSSTNGTTGVQTGTLFQRAGLTLDSGNGGMSIQKDIKTRIRQVCEAAGVALWIGEDQRITGKVYAPPTPSSTLTEITDNENIKKGSVTVDDNEKSRFNVVSVYYDLAAGGDEDKPEDYQKVITRADGDGLAAFYYGTSGIRIKQILSPWIRASDTATASRLAIHLLSRFRNPARIVSLDLEVKDDAIKCGDFIYLTTARLQKPDGTTDSQKIMQVQSKARDPKDHSISYTMQDTGLSRRYCFIAPAGFPNYDSATAAQRRYGFIGSAAGNKVGTLKDDGYVIW